MSDGAVIRELEGSQSGSINGMNISQDGQHFVTGVAPPLLVLCAIENVESLKISKSLGVLNIYILR